MSRGDYIVSLKGRQKRAWDIPAQAGNGFEYDAEYHKQV